MFVFCVCICVLPFVFYCAVCIYVCMFVFFCKQKTAYEMRISDWSSDVCSSDLPSRSWIKAYHAHKAQQIPVNWRISGEGMYAVHSIPYTAANQNALRSYFYGFGVWDENNTLLAWDQTIEV